MNILAADFGDGYSQPTPNGINHIKKNVSLSWKTLTYDQMRNIIDFFENMGGYQTFYWKPWGEQFAIKWTCKDWTAHDDSGIWEVDASFVQSFTSQT